MARTRASKPSSDPAAGLGFLLSQVGAHASARFAEHLEPLGLKPAHAAIMTIIEESDGLSQQALGERLGVFPSRLVGLLDELGRLGMVERRDRPNDRRSYALYVTAAGRGALDRVRSIARAHQAALCAALNASERSKLAEFLARIAAEQGLAPGVHPNFRKLVGEQPGTNRSQDTRTIT